MSKRARRRLDTELTAGRLAILMPSAGGTEAEKLDRILNSVYRAALELVQTGERSEAAAALKHARHSVPTSRGDELWNSVVRQVLEALDLADPTTTTQPAPDPTVSSTSADPAVVQPHPGTVLPPSPWDELSHAPRIRSGHRRAILLVSALVVVVAIVGTGYGGYRYLTRSTCPASAAGVGDVVGWDSPRVSEERSDLPDEIDGSSCAYDGVPGGGVLDVSLIRLRSSPNDFLRDDPLFGANITPGPELDCAREGDDLLANSVSDQVTVSTCTDSGLLINVRSSSSGVCGAALRFATPLVDADQSRAMIQGLNGLLDETDPELCRRGE